METSGLKATRRLVFWEPSSSPHKAHFFSALARLAPDCQIVECAEQGLGADRSALGWSLDPAGNYRRVIAPDDRLVDEIVAGGRRETLHVFSGIRWVPTIVKGLAAVRRSGGRLAILSEPRVREGWRGELRFLQSWLMEGWLRRRAELVLAIGRNGPPWFAGVGYPAERIFPFAYFVDPPMVLAQPPRPSWETGEPLQIGYLGRLVPAKGVRDIVRAAALLGKRPVIRVGGAGPDEARLQALSTELQVSAEFCGVIRMPMVGSFLAALDVLVLASRSKDDGWGVVVSEALMCGTAVVATNCAGASVVLDPTWLGRVVPASRPDLIAAAIADLSASHAFELAARERRAAWARSVLSATAGAQYLLKIVAWSEGERPRPMDFCCAHGAAREDGANAPAVVMSSDG